MQDMKVSLVQRELAWESPAENRDHIADALDAMTERPDLVVLPEMFTTGFSMNAVANAEAPGGPSEQWLQRQARRLDCAITGSIAVRDGEQVFNRMLFATPEACHHYDKRHLFRMAGEHKRYQGGKARVVVNWRGWRILLQVCYDLRFPVFSRNRNDYDLALYVANWPAARRAHWRQLLIARAIENLAYVIGVNRIGDDANGLHYSGDSLAIGPEGDIMADLLDQPATTSVTLSAAQLEAYRQRFPAHRDADVFQLD
ncbi:amidohydrolase [Pseudohalioglobus sediminis]|uniref:Omega-amidase YafV n=1 Tax=Pseudohalioglobus sediminis TaxID=2606449 RepID=A0A5B0X3U8_9GAMM|nr:amidohydrolase [Pseudohalioglobus sediminis]KAA1192849.1 amidohydrolase [Pseudohalioglobus sediminis]